jgi:hypothetical protein
MEAKQCKECQNLDTHVFQAGNTENLCMLYCLEIYKIKRCEYTKDVKVVDALYLNCPICGVAKDALGYINCNATGNQIYGCRYCGLTITIHRHSEHPHFIGRKFVIDNIKCKLEYDKKLLEKGAEVKKAKKVKEFCEARGIKGMYRNNSSRHSPADYLNLAYVDMAYKVICMNWKITELTFGHEITASHKVKIVKAIFEYLLPELYKKLSKQDKSITDHKPYFTSMKRHSDEFHNILEANGHNMSNLKISFWQTVEQLVPFVKV